MLKKINNELISKCKVDDAVYCINEMILDANADTLFEFKRNIYDIRSLYAHQEFCYISNNDYSLKNIAFPIIDKQNIIIDGKGSRLNCIGGILPFYIKNSENITVRDFVIDYERPFFSQGTVMESGDDYVVIDIDKKKYPYDIVNSLVRFLGEEYESYFVHGLLEYDKEERRPIPNSIDNFLKTSMRAEQTSEGYLKLFFDWNLKPTIGNIITIKHERRYYPAIAIDESIDIKLENITIHHAGTMGVVAQFSENIHIDKVDIIPDKDSDRVMSVNADATHFVNCSGTLLIENSRMESMLDDILNVHGNYFKVSHVISPREVIVEIPHFQQVGAFGLKRGAGISICDKDTMLEVGRTTLTDTKKINNRFFNLVFDSPFDFLVDKEYCVDDCESYPNVIFRNNVCGKNRARGILLTGKKPILIENNVIDTEGSAIKINGDMHNWYESTNTTSVIIRGNKISRKNKANWGTAIIDIDPAMKTQVQGEFFHGDMMVEDNEVIIDGTPFFYGYSFGNLTVKNNHFITYDKDINSDETLSIEASNCKSFIVENNTYTTK